MQPTQNQVHVDRILTNISVAYMQRAENFIARKVFPVVPVDKQSDLFYVYNKEDWFRDEAKPRADATESAGGGYNLSTGTYRAQVYAFHKDIGDQVRANADAAIDVDRDATEFVTQRLMLREEKQFNSSFFQTNIWATDRQVANQWSDYAGSNPHVDIELGKRTILSTTGYMPNTLVLGYDVFTTLKNHPDIVDRIKYTSSNTITVEMLAKMFEIDRVFVTMAIENTSPERAPANFQFVYGKNAWLGYVAPSPSLLAPSAGYTFVWRGVSDGLGKDIGTVKFRMPHLRADRVESQIAWDNRLIAPDMGYFFQNVIA